MTKLNSSFMIGNVEIPHRTVLAPMAGVTNSGIWCWSCGYVDDL